MLDKTRKTSDALRTYRYLRIGMISAVVLLGVSVVIEARDQHYCWETSISAYWYTPAKSVLVGVLVAMGFAMVVIKGRGAFEDNALNFAGMFAPIVALAPTATPGAEAPKCNVTVPPGIEDMVDNNLWALLITGGFCLVVGFAITVALSRNVKAPFTNVDDGTWITLVAATVAVTMAIVLMLVADFDEVTRFGHPGAAGAMFVCMFLAAAAAALQAKKPTYRWLYRVTALGMASGLLLVATRIFGEHELLALETWEIVWFGVFWAVQTAERWNEPPEGSDATIPVVAA